MTTKDKIKIRTVTADDAAELLNIYAPYVTDTAITFEYDVPSLGEFKARIENTLKTYPYYAAVCGGEIVGYAYASRFHERKAYDWAVETSIYVDRNKKGLGIGRRLYKVLENVLAQQNILNLNACIAYPSQEDEYLTRDSVKFHEHLGYRLVGKFDQCGYKFHKWYNMVWMEKHIGPHPENQPEMIVFREIHPDVKKTCGIQ